MYITQNIVAKRVTGTLEIELEDGRAATLEVDVDVSNPDASWGMENEYAEERYGGGMAVRLAMPVAQAYAVHLPCPRPSEKPTFTLRVPFDDES